MPFNEICIYQVNPQLVGEFENLMFKVRELMEKQNGLIFNRLVKREYYIDMEQIKKGSPPPKITRIVKSVKYILISEFNTEEDYGRAQKLLYETYWKSIDKCLIMPHDKFLGLNLF